MNQPFEPAAPAPETHLGEPVGTLGRRGGRLLLVTLTLGQMAQGLAFTGFITALPQMALDLGPRGELFAQMTIAFTALGVLVGSLAGGGWLLERGGSRLTLMAAAILFGAAGTVGLITSAPLVLLASQFLVGFASACMVTACLWAIATEYSGHARALAMGTSSAMGSGVALLGTLAGGYLTRHGGWHLAFLQYPLFVALALALVAACVLQAFPPRNPASLRPPRLVRPLLPFLLLTVVIFVVMFMGSTQLAFLLAADGVRDPGNRSFILGLTTVVGTLTGFSYGAVHKRLGIDGAFLAGLIAATLALLLIGSTGLPWVAAVGAALLGVYAGLAVPFVYHSVSERTDEYTRGRAAGLTNAFSFFGAFLNPLILSVLGRFFGIHGSFIAMAFVTAALAAGIVTARLKRSTVAARS